MAKPGAVVVSLTEDTMDYETGIAVKLGEGVQALSGFVSGIIVAFYFSWEITLVSLIAVPMMSVGFGIMLASGVGEDGVTGKKAFEAAANIATETLGAMRTVISFGPVCVYGYMHI